MTRTGYQVSIIIKNYDPHVGPPLKHCYELPASCYQRK